ncbi:hypothetical protein D3C81_857140 [compost metagenome]
MVALVAVQRGEEGPERHRRAALGNLPGQVLHRKDLVVERPAPVRHEVKLGVPGMDFHPVGAHREQVDHRCAEQRELARIDLAREHPRRPGQQDHDLGLAAVDAGQSGCQPVEPGEIEPLRAREILVHEVVPVKLVPGQGQGAFLRCHADVADRMLRNCVGPLAHRARLADEHGDAGTMQQLEQVRGDLVVAAQVKRQGVKPGQLGERDIAGQPQSQAQRPLHGHVGWHVAFEMPDVRRDAGKPGLGELDWPQCQRLGRAKFALGRFARRRTGQQRGAARYRDAADQVAFLVAGMEPRHRDRRRRRDVVGIDDFQQALGEAREFRIELQLRAGGQEAERFDEALHIGIGHLDAMHAQAPGHLGVLVRELSRQLAHVDQFAVVVLKQLRVHGDGKASVGVNRLDLHAAGFQVERALGGEGHRIGIHVDQAGNLEQQHVEAMRRILLQQRRDAERARDQARLEILDGALDDADEVVPFALGQVASCKRGYAVVERRAGSLGIACAIDLVFAVGGVEQVGEIALDDLAHLRARDGVLLRRFCVVVWRVIAQAVEQCRQQLRVRAAGRAGAAQGRRRAAVRPVRRLAHCPGPARVQRNRRCPWKPGGVRAG